MDDTPIEPADAHPRRAVRGIALALLLSAPVWFGLGVWIWRVSQP